MFQKLYFCHVYFVSVHAIFQAEDVLLYAYCNGVWQFLVLSFHISSPAVISHICVGSLCVSLTCGMSVMLVYNLLDILYGTACCTYFNLFCLMQIVWDISTDIPVYIEKLKVSTSKVRRSIYYSCEWNCVSNDDCH